jgi:hypothetical protein
MRTLIDLEEGQIKRLDILGKKEKLSRTELVRRAVAQFLESRENAAPGPLMNDIRGMVVDGDPRYFDGLDALSYEQKIRAEWDRGGDPYHKGWGLNERPQQSYDEGPVPVNKGRGRKKK